MPGFPLASFWAFFDLCSSLSSQLLFIVCALHNLMCHKLKVELMESIASWSSVQSWTEDMALVPAFHLPVFRSLRLATWYIGKENLWRHYLNSETSDNTIHMAVSRQGKIRISVTTRFPFTENLLTISITLWCLIFMYFSSFFFFWSHFISYFSLSLCSQLIFFIFLCTLQC